MSQSEKVTSKYYRIRMSDEIREVIESLPFKDLAETQVGNHVYSGSGSIQIGESYFPVTLRIRLVDGIPTVYLKSPGKIDATWLFNEAKTELPIALVEAAKLLLN